jgi:hypothetical protein
MREREGQAMVSCGTGAMSRGIGTAAALAALFAAGGAEAGPRREESPVTRADICAVAARPELPGYDPPPFPERASGAEIGAIVDRTHWQYAYWGDCPVRPGAIESLSFSPDGRYALTEGGWQSGPIEGGWGYCLFEKTDSGWLPMACVTTAIS